MCGARCVPDQPRGPASVDGPIPRVVASQIKRKSGYSSVVSERSSQTSPGTVVLIDRTAPTEPERRANLASIESGRLARQSVTLQWAALLVAIAFGLFGLLMILGGRGDAPNPAVAGRPHYSIDCGRGRNGIQLRRGYMGREAWQRPSWPICVSVLICGAVALAGCGSSSGSSAAASTNSPSSSSSLSTTTTNCPAGQVPVGDAGACAPATTESTESTATTNNSQGPLSLGQAAQFAGGVIIGQGADEMASVTVQHVIDPADRGVISLGIAAPPAPSGQRRVAIELSVQNIGSGSWSESPGDLLSLISKSTNGPVGQALPGTTGPGQCATDLSQAANIAPGQTEKGCVFFQVPTDQQIRAVQFETQDGEGGNLATWNVS